MRSSPDLIGRVFLCAALAGLGFGQDLGRAGGVGGTRSHMDFVTRGMAGEFPGRMWACYAPGTDRAYIERTERLLGLDQLKYLASDRWSATASNGATGAVGDPIILTWSVVADGGDNLINTAFDAQFGSRDAWIDLIQRSFDEWSAFAGVTFVYEPNDDGSDDVGEVGVRGDIRITATVVDGPDGILAYAFYPDFGDVNFDVTEFWGDSSGDYFFFRNVLTHETGHALGLGHVGPYDETKLMEEYYTTQFDGPQDDDIRGMSFNYGDAREQNDGSSLANDMGAYSPSATFDNLSMNADEDWYAFSTGGTGVVVRVTPIGSVYPVGPVDGPFFNVNTTRIRPLRVDIYDAGSPNPRRVAIGAWGQVVTTVPIDLGSGFKIRVSSAEPAPDVQRYRLSFSTSSGPARKLHVEASGAAGVQITASPADGVGVSTATAPVDLLYANNQSVQVTAPASGAGLKFVSWSVDDIQQTAGQATVTVNMTRDRRLVALFADAPTADVGPDIAIVLNDSTKLTATAGGGVPPYQYEWTPTDGLSSRTSPVTTAAPRVDTTYACRVTDSTGAFGTDELLVTVLPALAVNAGKSVLGVAGGSFTLSATATGGIPPYTFSWTPANMLNDATVAAPTGVFSRSTVFTVNVADSAGHTAKSTVAVTVPGPVVVELGDTRLIRGGESVEIRAKVTGGHSPFTYQWDPPAAIASSNGAVATIKSDVNVTVRVMVADSLGQQGADEVAVDIAAPLQVTASADPAAVGVGQQLTLAGNVTGGVPPYTFEWAPVVNVADPHAQQTTATPIVTTTFGVNVRDSLGQTGAASVRVEVGAASAAAADDSSLDNPSGNSGTNAAGGCAGGPLAVISLLLCGLSPVRRRCMGRNRPD